MSRDVDCNSKAKPQRVQDLVKSWNNLEFHPFLSQDGNEEISLITSSGNLFVMTSIVLLSL